MDIDMQHETSFGFLVVVVLFFFFCYFPFYVLQAKANNFGCRLAPPPTYRIRPFRVGPFASPKK